MKGPTTLMEDKLRLLRTRQSFERGRQDYRAGAFRNVTCQDNRLTALADLTSLMTRATLITHYGRSTL